MDFKLLGINLLASIFIVARRTVLLIITPYKAMRRISLDRDRYQLFILFAFAGIYFLFAQYFRGSVGRGIVSFFLFLVQFYATAGFFYVVFRRFQKEVKFESFIYTMGYSLIPTLIWFYSNLVLYLLLPPPRTMSILGKGFSVFFVAYSSSLLIWKLILVYFALRFSSRLGLYRIIYVFLLYLLIAVPLSVVMYYFRVFRVPFI